MVAVILAGLRDEDDADDADVDDWFGIAVPELGEGSYASVKVMDSDVTCRICRDRCRVRGEMDVHREEADDPVWAFMADELADTGIVG